MQTLNNITKELLDSGKLKGAFIVRSAKFKRPEDKYGVVTIEQVNQMSEPDFQGPETNKSQFAAITDRKERVVVPFSENPHDLLVPLGNDNFLNSVFHDQYKGEHDGNAWWYEHQHLKIKKGKPNLVNTLYGEIKQVSNSTLLVRTADDAAIYNFEQGRFVGTIVRFSKIHDFVLTGLDHKQSVAKAEIKMLNGNYLYMYIDAHGEIRSKKIISSFDGEEIDPHAPDFDLAAAIDRVNRKIADHHQALTGVSLTESL